MPEETSSTHGALASTDNEGRGAGGPAGDGTRGDGGVADGGCSGSDSAACSVLDATAQHAEREAVPPKRRRVSVAAPATAVISSQQSPQQRSQLHAAAPARGIQLPPGGTIGDPAETIPDTRPRHGGGERGSTASQPAARTSPVSRLEFDDAVARRVGGAPPEETEVVLSHAASRGVVGMTAAEVAAACAALKGGP